MKRKKIKLPEELRKPFLEMCNSIEKEMKQLAEEIEQLTAKQIFEDIEKSLDKHQFRRGYSDEYYFEYRLKEWILEKIKKKWIKEKS